MTTTQFLMLLGIAVSASIALIVASQQRKQMRQIELYKSDPTVGLVPPPSAFSRFIKSKWDILLGFGIPLVNLVIQLMSREPISKTSVLIISLSIAFLLVNIVATVIFRVVDRISKLIVGLTGAVESHFEITQSHGEMLESQTKLIAEILNRESSLIDKR